MTNDEVDFLIKKMEESKPAGRCWFGHKWSRWSESFLVKALYIDYYNKEHSINIEKQKRFCLKCYIIEEREVR